MIIINMRISTIAIGLVAATNAYTYSFNSDIVGMNLEEQANWGKSYPDAHGDAYIALSAADKL